MRKIIVFLRKVISKINQDSIMKESAALTFITVLSFIPFLLLIFFIIPDIPGLNIREHLQELFLSILLPDSVETATSYVSNLLDQKMPSNIFNIALLILTSFGLFKFINGAFDRILNVTEFENKSIIYKLGKFIVMIFFGFIFILVLFSSTSVSLIAQIFDFPFIRNISFIIIPFLMFFFVNLFIYFFASTVHFRASSLVIGSAVAAAIWIIVKMGFDFYISNLTNMEVVYGVIATLPIFLFWIYLNWAIILFGVVLIAILENKESNIEE
ncbi:MAG: YihY/virulence factor BrkB family protein [Candidatus Cloacimonetes bacterium]|nr:YihY/virulence factor BrkB family protein [Candidatus Cloacimonadota bacterium]